MCDTLNQTNSRPAINVQVHKDNFSSLQFHITWKTNCKLRLIHVVSKCMWRYISLAQCEILLSRSQSSYDLTNIDQHFVYPIIIYSDRLQVWNKVYNLHSLSPQGISCSQFIGVLKDFFLLRASSQSKK